MQIIDKPGLEAGFAIAQVIDPLPHEGPVITQVREVVGGSSHRRPPAAEGFRIVNADVIQMLDDKG
jgi:hypothetical protein